ncbi:Deoxyribonuclease-2-alpha [Orchesella cincta]|uniref:Deoxyribonuclease-2-alpha n=1 Tax=Orchesella cincta TaxID=48709 RepID=A0A1D2NGT1_ORCCI|nr:Deoxyribonuclease-2-alpha [Orchesella cincta]
MHPAPVDKPTRDVPKKHSCCCCCRSKWELAIWIVLIMGIMGILGLISYKIIYEVITVYASFPFFTMAGGGSNEQRNVAKWDNTNTNLQYEQHQANDILTKLTKPQGQINDQYHQDRAASRIREFVGIDSGSKTKVNFNSDALRDKTESIPKPQESMGSTQPMNCKDELGNDVSWFYAYKLPLLSESTDPLIKNGSKYFYLVPNSTSWVSSEFPINSEKSILAKTLDTVWAAENDRKGLAQVIYNDQPPTQPAMVMNGHTKGLVLTSTEGGFWLQHSCPHFPNIQAENFSSSYPVGGLINGQMFFCMSLGNVSNVDVVGTVLQYTKPLIYNYTIPTEMEKLLPQLTQVATKNATVEQAPWFNTFKLQAGDLNLTVFVKGPKFHKEIYSAWIAPEYETSLDVQSWLNGAHPFPSNCTSNQFPVFNVLSKTVGGQSFSYTDDHSKWAVSANSSAPITCVGDLNRMKPQKTRGGVAVCVSNKPLWDSFQSLVQVTQPCNMTRL